MKLKNTIVFSLLSMLVGFIPLYNKTYDIRFEIRANSISHANKIKEDLIMFYKEHCYSSLFDSIDSKIVNNLDNFNYTAVYDNYTICVKEGSKIKMTGYLYKTNPPSIKFKYYFSASINSMPEAISTSVATLSLSE